MTILDEYLWAVSSRRPTYKPLKRLESTMTMTDQQVQADEAVRRAVEVARQQPGWETASAVLTDSTVGQEIITISAGEDSAKSGLFFTLPIAVIRDTYKANALPSIVEQHIDAVQNADNKANTEGDTDVEVDDPTADGETTSENTVENTDANEVGHTNGPDDAGGNLNLTTTLETPEDGVPQLKAYEAGAAAARNGEPRELPVDSPHNTFPVNWFAGYDAVMDEKIAGNTDAMQGCETDAMTATEMAHSTEIRKDSGLTNAMHLERFGFLNELPPEHPDRVENRAAYKHGWSVANAQEPRTPPFYTNDATTRAWLAGYDDFVKNGDVDGPPKTAEEEMLETVDVKNLDPQLKREMVLHDIQRVLELTAGDDAYNAMRGYLIEARNVCPTC